MNLFQEVQIQHIAEGYVNVSKLLGHVLTVNLRYARRTTYQTLQIEELA